MIELDIGILLILLFFLITILLNKQDYIENSFQTVIAQSTWIAFGVYWFYSGANAILSGEITGYWIEFSMIIMSFTSFYFAYIYGFREYIGDRLTLGFFTMSLTYLVFSSSEILKQKITEFTAFNTLKLLHLMGVEAVIIEGNKLALQNQAFIMEIILICTGLSAVSFGIGLISMSRLNIKRKLVGGLLFSLLIYIVAVIRAAIVLSIQYWGLFEWWPSGGMMSSFYFAEEIITPIYVLVFGILICSLILDTYPDVEKLFVEVLDQFKQDVGRIYHE